MTNSVSKTYIINDQWTDIDALDFKPYVETLADIIQTGNTPLTIGIFGTWGSGKTSLMKMLRNGIPESAYNGLPKEYTIAWFDAWKYDKEETLWRAFLLNVLFAVEKKSGETEELKSLKTMLYRGLEIEKTGGVTIDLAKLGVKVAEGAVQIGLSFIPPLATLADMAKELQKAGRTNVQSGFEDAIRRERTKIYVEQVRSLEQFQEKFATLIQSYVSPNRLVVFVDDLDRCLPEKSIQVLEAIKLFLDVKDCVFILGVDQDVIARGIEMKYKEFRDRKDEDGQPRFTIEGIKYLEKIIQLPFQIPPVIQDDMEVFVKGLSNEWPHPECPLVFATGLGNNPRQIKRTVNTFLMLSKLSEKRNEKLKGQVKPIRLAKVVAIQAVHPDLYNQLLKDEPRYLLELEKYYSAELSEKDIKLKDTPEKQENSMQPVEPPPALVPFLSQRGIAAVRRILTMKHHAGTTDAIFSDLPPDELKLYFTLARSAELPQVTPTVETVTLGIEPQMVNIPAGKFLMGSTKEQAAQMIKDGAKENWVTWEQPQHTIMLSDYFIGRYPVTNREYQAFVLDTRYKPPRGWDGDQFPFENGDHPVVNVSWNDADAYCKWLAEKSGKPYRLPTEAEWEKAARGQDGRIYSWGNDFAPKKANTFESNIGGTTAVGRYSNNNLVLSGDSPFGCADMIGNVWEWCQDWWGAEYEQRQNAVQKEPRGPAEGEMRVLRGGSFSENLRNARCANRYAVSPHTVYRSFGFRVAYSPVRPDRTN